RVLFIAYNFPPHGGAGVQRSLKFVKYLPQFGWQPLVVTTTAEASPIQDPTLLQDIPPHTPITRIPGFSIFHLQQQAQKYRLHRLAVLLNVLLQIPDPTRFWAKKIQPTLDDLIRQHQPELIYTTSGPYSAHLAGRWLRQRTNLPWLADFRDPWSQNLLMPYAPGYRALNARLERQVLTTADKITCVSRPWLNDLQQNLGHSPGKFTVLPNGYDETDLETSPLPASGERFILTHIGSFYRNRRPDELIQAVEQLVAHGRVPAEKLLIRFIGKNAQRFAPDHPSFEAIDY
ncbi:MAG: glycosyltransferase, partial [Anaerolineales bacterium]|nr:glycosyltransferase [Anaerolineales bacterium]